MPLGTRGVLVSLKNTPSDQSDAFRQVEQLSLMKPKYWLGFPAAVGYHGTFTDFGGGYGQGGYVIDALGWVHLLGEVSSGGGINSSTTYTVAGLPPNVTPAVNKQFGTTLNAGFAMLPCIIMAASNGTITLSTPSTWTNGTTGTFNLEGMIYKPEIL